MEPSIEIIRQAIREHKLLEFRYHSLPRIVEPMRLGQVNRGKWELRAHRNPRGLRQPRERRGQAYSSVSMWTNVGSSRV